MKLLVSTWIPRSFLHIFEVDKHIKEFGFESRNVKIGNSVEFDIYNYKGYSPIKFKLDGSGQYELSFDNVNDIERAIKDAEDIILEKIIKKAHGVTYKQIKNDVLPLMFSSAVFSRLNVKIDMPMKLAGSYKVYYDIREKFSGDSMLYIIGDERVTEESRYFNYTACVSSFLYRMMDKMSVYYNDADKIVNLLEESIGLSDLKKAVFGFDLLKKDIGESLSKIQQMKINYDRKFDSYEKANLNKPLKNALDLDGAFYRVLQDWEYIQTLWELLNNYIGNVDDASEARLSFQESIESRKIEGLLSIESASVIASLIMAIFITQFTGTGAAILFASFIVIWLILYIAIVYIKPRKKEVSSKNILKK